ncbi:MAG: methyltransferase [Acidimicrobiaceae bacterium]|nr:methyltransferase [Acidimicrobiaceae bacterium]MYC43308.1 methyltransferase [Acidimicrobiaceae bacterium]MYH87129.1 methyltransferase [Acidimicrobiaceae bacterium]
MTPGSGPEAVSYDSGSFRDPDSRVWRDGSRVLRGLNEAASADFAALSATSFYRGACTAGDLVRSEPVEATFPEGSEWALVLEHEPVEVITYAHEWSFSMLQDAANLTLKLVRAAIDEDMTSKDATPYNVQFVGAKPTFIDLSSFERYRAGEPWWGYRQFCQMFLYPLMFTAYKDLPHQPWMRGAVDGITPEQARRVLQGRRHASKGLIPHVWLHAKADRRFSGGSAGTVDDLKKAGYNKKIYVGLVDRLRKLVDNLSWNRSDSAWADYSQRSHYASSDLQSKADFVGEVVVQRHRSHVWDIGANDGMFSRIAAENAEHVLAMDADALVVDRLYRTLREDGTEGVIPLVVNFADPTPGIGWRGVERPALTERSRPELVLALAVIHHLALTHNVPTAAILDFLYELSAEVVLEVPTESDWMVKELKSHKRAGTHDAYTLAVIETQINERFDVRRRSELKGGTRVLFDLVPKA